MLNNDATLCGEPSLQRRTFLQSLTATAAFGVVAAEPTDAATRARWVGSDETSWPSSALWDRLKENVGGRLVRVRSPLEDCARSGGSGAESLFAKLKNPYFLGDDPGLTQTLGWTDAWTSQPSAYAVAAQSSSDVAAAVNFAREHRVRIVVRGGGHSYFGNSNAKDSLLIWPRHMRDVVLHDDFVCRGCQANAAPVSAVSVGAGALWGDVYRQVSVNNGRYVQGGGCLTVGVAGFVQGGGFGSLSKAFGTGAGNLIEAEVVTADGIVRIANRTLEPDLFWALKGGGGGSFGVVTRLTMATHALPETIGAIQFSVNAQSDAAWRALVAAVISFYASSLFNPTWGEILRFEPGRRLVVAMMFHGLTEHEVRAIWQPFLEWVASHAADYSMIGKPLVIAAPGRSFWDPDYLRKIPGAVVGDERSGTPSSNVFWSANQGEAGQILHAYDSAWLPARLLRRGEQPGLVTAIVEASARWTIALHLNKGLAGGSKSAIEASRETATNPAMLDAFALLICAADGPPAWRGVPGHEPEVERGRRDAASVALAMKSIRHLVPDAGSYMSEADYFRPDWRQSYWADHHTRLVRAKQRYDPHGLFNVHHGITANV